MPGETIQQGVNALADELAERGVRDIRLAFVLGSGLGAFADGLARRTEIHGEELEHLPASAVPGHAGRFVVGELAGVRVLVQEGRVHLYEGWSAHEVTRAVRAFQRLGIEQLVLTNAAGSMVPEFAPGSLLRVEDHLNLQGCAPLLQDEQRRGSPYDAAMGRLLDETALELGITLQRGIYSGVLGPAYETPAEIAMLQKMGGHAVGMSTVAEASAARAAGLRVATVACLTNYASGITDVPLNHADVVRVGRSIAADLVRLFEAAVPRLVG